MGKLFVLLFLAQVALAVFALIGCLSAEDGEIRGLPKIAWVIVILLFPLIGPISWFLAGRPLETGARHGNTRRPGSGRLGSGFPEPQRPRRPVAPDDDPEFLRSLRRDDRELLAQWEADLRRREEELRKREQRPEDDHA